ncbi:hypothetical protein PH210_06070 [Paenibacillus sp. BSR1-1]|uniref:hypothetical protein n=1 Tax=Paenibacillus sp. BSR1-1 TaxID=3020845 RepID=UPI0025B00215|nr:hypothetical protein [Paenibacillus sp. BSR1-1]MDN3015772.1 hypothetical protein [Paenibacillus sp. BSR1-1]
MKETKVEEISVENINSWILSIGLKEAFLLYQLHKLIENKGHLIKGEKWVNITYDELHEHLSIWSKSSIKRLVHLLEEKGYIVSANWNESKLDKSKWYTLNYQKLKKLDPHTYRKLMASSGNGDSDSAGDSTEID